MPFEPRLVPADDPRTRTLRRPTRQTAPWPIARIVVQPSPLLRAGSDACTTDEEFDLPIHLAALADQLRDDADHLVRCYPATQSVDGPQAMRAARSHKSGWVRWSAAAAVLLIVATWPSVAERLATVDRSGSNVVSSKESIARVERGDRDRAAGRAIQQHEHEIALRPSQEVQEVSVGADAPSRPRHPPADEVEMLRIQISGFQKVIERLQAELSARDQSQADMVKLIKSLQDEIATLKGQGARDKGQGTEEKDAAHRRRRDDGVFDGKVTPILKTAKDAKTDNLDRSGGFQPPLLANGGWKPPLLLALLAAWRLYPCSTTPPNSIKGCRTTSSSPSMAPRDIVFAGLACMRRSSSRMHSGSCSLASSAR